MRSPLRLRCPESESQSAGVSMPEHPQPATPSAAPAHSTEERPSAPLLPSHVNGTFAVPAVPTAASSSHSSIPPGAPVVSTPAVTAFPVDAPNVAHANAAPARQEEYASHIISFLSPMVAIRIRTHFQHI
eukprot:6197423-Pleurochrysis_carterae.AAC.2